MLCSFSEFEHKGRKFTVLYDTKNKGYWAVEDKYIENGKVTRELNGLKDHFSTEYEKTVENAKAVIEAEYLRDVEGVSPLAALGMVALGMSREQAEAIAAKAEAQLAGKRAKKRAKN